MSGFVTIDGIDVPGFFYGTAWKEDRTAQLTEQALRAGFRDSRWSKVATGSPRGTYLAERLSPGFRDFDLRYLDDQLYLYGQRGSACWFW